MGILHNLSRGSRLDLRCISKLAGVLCPRHPRQVIRHFLQLVQSLENELGCNPVLRAVLPRHLDDKPIVAIGDGVAVVDLGEEVDKFGVLCHILIPCSVDASHMTGTDI
jgi:hypothetical protein